MAAKIRGYNGYNRYNHPKFLGAAITRCYNHPRGESSLRYILRTIDKRQINFPHAGWPVLFVVMFVVWSGPLHVPGGSHVGEFPVRWLWNPWERRGNTSTLDELPVWCALQHWNTRGETQFWFAPSWLCVDPLPARCRVEDGGPISNHYMSPSLHMSSFPRRQTPVTPPTCHTAGSKKTEPSCRRTDLLAT